MPLLTLLLIAFAGTSQQLCEASDSVSKKLNEITVIAERPGVKLEGSTIVTTIAGTQYEKLGSILDVLTQMPMINVSDREITVSGKGAPEIYIDGHPLRDFSELTLLRPDNVDKIMLLLAPGAMYNNDVAAVVKIVTRKKFIDGLSLTQRAEVIARRKVSANELLDLTYRMKHNEFYVTLVGAHNNSQVNGTTTNRLVYNGKPVEIGSCGKKEYPSENMSVKAGMNYADSKRSAGGFYRYSPEWGDFNNSGSEWIDQSARILRTITQTTTAQSHYAIAYYEEEFNQSSRLHIDADFKHAHSKENTLTGYADNTYRDIETSTQSNSTFCAGKIYYEMPLLGGRFTLGTQESYTETHTSFNMFSKDVAGYIPSSATDTRQLSAAAFASLDRRFGKVNLTMGLRYEYSDFLFKVNNEKDAGISRHSNLLTPDINVAWDITNRSSLSLNYRCSTVKPPYSRLTGSLNYVGIHEIEGGNPALRNERMHTLQLLGIWDTFILQTVFTRSTDTYAYVKDIYPAESLQLVMSPRNIDISALDFFLVWSKEVHFWSPSITTGVHHQWLELFGNNCNQPIFQYYFDNTFSLPGNWLITLNVHGSSQGYMHTNRFAANWFIADTSISKSFMNNNLQIKLAATDIFDTAKNNWSMNTNGIEVIKTQKYDNRGVSLTLTYRFQPTASSFKGLSAAGSELNRL